MASPRVLAALASPIVFDYDPVFLEHFRETERLLAQLLPHDNDVVLDAGRGGSRHRGLRPGRSSSPEPGA